MLTGLATVGNCATATAATTTFGYDSAGDTTAITGSGNLVTNLGYDSQSRLT